MKNSWRSRFLDMEGATPRRLLLHACTLCVAAAALTASANASASCQDGTDHCYGIVIKTNMPDNDAARGISIDINTNALDEQDCSQFVTHEMWYGLFGDGSYWIEVGFNAGAGQAGCTRDAPFWADQRYKGGYHEHYPNVSWLFDTWYALEVARVSACTWDVWMGGQKIGTSTSNCTIAGAGRYAAAGIETTVQAKSGHARGFLITPLRRDSTGTLQDGWDGPGFFQDRPPLIQGPVDGQMEDALYLPW